MCGEGAVTNQMCQKRLHSFVLEISRRTMLHGQADQLKLIVIKSEKCLSFTEKTKRTFWPTQYVISYVGKYVDHMESVISWI